MAKVNMIANMAKASAVPAQAADELIYDLPAATPPTPVEQPVAGIKIPFTNQLTPETFLRLKQFECWGAWKFKTFWKKH
ncbi:hypothetical protein [Hymenobacter volaticus]|uniref:Uncharacterized protein n=1 Tax=Hymenobacter volaticus TaxID=2932254 RepID=A0ABY4GE65_9BACT|nr:hypothetical protein [Hymenobacter volaticus]UOQ69195.1 hypothetical protein MUN86_27465 [Hymenobacter volaticus]